MSTEHPIALELVSLRAALDKYQHAAHTSSLQLQRARFDASEAAARSKILEADNTRLQQEVNLLRDNADSAPASLPVSELTLALRRMSDKLSQTEDILLSRTTELAHSISEASRTKLEIVAGREQLDRARQREEAWRQRERELEMKCKTTEEEARMADVVVTEYADLVRSLEGRRSKASTADTSALNYPSSPSSSMVQNGDLDAHHQATSDGLVQSFTENRFGVRRLLHDFNTETSHLQVEITRLHSELSSMQADLDCERENSKLDRVKLAEALLDVDRCKTDDGAAAKIVSRYMQFSQSSINTLQSALSAAKVRHAATLSTVSKTSEALTASLTIERMRASKLRDALDELTEDISRETFGRRREISLRLQSLVREEKITEALSAWVRRAKERRAKLPIPVATDSAEYSQAQVDTAWRDLDTLLAHMIQEALAMLATLSHEDRLDDVADNSSLGRIILAEDMVRSLRTDLEKETENRMKLTRKLAKEMFISPTESSVEPTGVVPIENDLHSPSSRIDPRATGAAISSPTLEAVEAIPSSVSKNNDLPIIETASQLLEPKTIVMDDTRRSHNEREGKAGEDLGMSDIQASTVAPELPFLEELTGISHRYDELQRAFHDCHLTLAKLKADVAATPLVSQSGLPIFQNVVRRLDDFCEDTRVEIEIRIADEERIAKGFETLLGVPGALAGEKEKGRIQLELRAFLDGTTSSVMKAIETCKSKLEDLQHDIAQVKLGMHEAIEAASEVQSQAPPKTPPGWSPWTPPFLSGPSSRPASPAPSFGTVITSPRPRRVSSNSLFSFPSRATSESKPAASDPYSHLGLRITMPSQVQPASPLQPTSARLRKTSSMYLLGLGSRSGFFTKQDPIAEGASLSQDNEGELETHNSESDVE